MKKYLIVFLGYDKKGSYVANLVAERDKKIASQDDIAEILASLKENTTAKNPVIINILPLPI